MASLFNLYIREGSEEQAKLLLEDERFNKQYFDSPSGRNPIHWAAWAGRTDILKILISKHVRLDV